jgi:acyl dehydratase
MSVTTEEDTDFTTRLQAFVGRDEGPTLDAVVDPFVVTRLVEALGDRNPIYTDPEAAAASVHGRVVAPVTALMSWTVEAKPRPRCLPGGHPAVVAHIVEKMAGAVVQ